jgi:energy-coupling factor transporter ATP-binding protein EcfA2
MRQTEIPDDEWRTILERQILPVWTDGAPRQEQPVVVFVAGQPGSGKTRAADLVHAVMEHRGGAVRIGSDLYKKAHPRYAALLAEDVRTAGAAVRHRTRGWQEAVEAHTRAHRHDAVVETALADLEEFRASAAAYRRAGFRREIVALAVAEAVSQLSLLERFVAGAVEGTGGRYVSWGNHDGCAAGMVRTLAGVETEQCADRIIVVRRDWTVLYENELAGGAWRRQPGAARALAQERTRPWTARETEQFERQLAHTDRRLHGEVHREDHRLAVHRDAARAAALAEPLRRIAQPRAQPPGIDYHRLSAAEHRRIFEGRVLPALGPVTAQEQPIAVYVVAQPGAGKSAAADLVAGALPGATRISSGDFKRVHPDYAMLLGQDPRMAGAAIRTDYKAWQSAAEAHVRERRGHMVVEVAPGSASGLLARVERAHAAGYRTHVVAMAVRAADSRQGTAQRYASALRAGAAARFTTVDGHDRCYDGVADAVAAAETHPAVDTLSVLSRDLDLLWRQTGPRPQAASLALLAERRRLYTEAEAQRFMVRHRDLRRALPQHGAELDQIAALARPLFPPAVVPGLTSGSGSRSAACACVPEAGRRGGAGTSESETDAEQAERG